MSNLFQKVKMGKIKDTKNIDDIRNFIFNYFEADLKAKPSLHKYTNKMPIDF
jgi:hypothetical protein